MNKSFRELKQKQKDKIINWIYEEYKNYVSENGSVPGEQGDAQIMSAVLDKIEQAGIWIPSYEIEDYYVSRKARLKQRYENEKRLKYKEYVDFYKSVIDQDRSAVVMCNLNHEIIYMNPATITYYEKGGGEQLIGKSILDCHNEDSQRKMKQVVEWFAASPKHNLVYTFYHEKQNKDVYMIAFRSGEELIGYYEKHEFRNRETMKMYDLW
jgi:PAS domain-containing protein